MICMVIYKYAHLLIDDFFEVGSINSLCQIFEFISREEC